MTLNDLRDYDYSPLSALGVIFSACEDTLCKFTFYIAPFQMRYSYGCVAVDKISTDIVRRAVPLQYPIFYGCLTVTMHILWRSDVAGSSQSSRRPTVSQTRRWHCWFPDDSVRRIWLRPPALWSRDSSAISSHTR